MIIFINGTISAGKSTVSKLLAERLPQCAVVEPDELRNFVRWVNLDEAIPITIENTICILKNFSKAGYDVVVPYPIDNLTQTKLNESLSHITELHFFTLNPDIKKCLTNTIERTLTDWEVSRIKFHHQSGLTNPNFGTIIDSTNQTPKQTSDQIFEMVDSSKA